VRVREPRVQPVFWRWIVRSRGPFRWRTGHVTPQAAQTWSADQDEQGCLRLVAGSQVAQPLLDERRARKPCGLHARSIVPGAYFVAAPTLMSMAAIVLSHAMVMVAPASVTFVNPIVNCSTDESAVRTVMGARRRSNFGS